MSPRSTILRAAIVTLAVIVADQLTKALVRAEIDRFEEIELILGIKLVHTRNTGVAFSMLSGGGPLVVIIACVALAALLIFFFTHLRQRLIWLPVGMLLGGAAGNLIDRIRIGAVTDFIDFPYWPAFNVADIGVTFGVIVLIIVLEVNDRRSRT
ncbi:signal peptidase II [Solirubrobacter sp. CPCC 204708]|uniref:Lipoprotein signal peptidase n=1 Tax=Solirubrobacter deserti TaxID=2282478 RepID=A0ABT4RS04_9ACTN|nr:signal peptidase II [Solirubrobacter deserti]MBE2315106.1 signal peptidase II [Solirubrobacter deserti]MDA0141372.1 signal peptidase II [Solirubrobacter deserti]